MKKEINAWDVVDGIWNFVLNGDISETKGLTWGQTVKHILKTNDISSFSIDEGVKKFLYEKKYFFNKPNRSTMNHLWGEHVLLYDIWGCKKHMFTIETSDDVYKYVDGQTVACPFCNKDIMTDEGFLEYVSLGKLHDKESWDSVLKTAKLHKKWNRKENFKYMLKHLFDLHYWKMKIKYG